MKRICDSTSIVASREIGRRTYEVCATVVADFDDASEQLILTLDCFVRHVVHNGPDVILRPSWLARPETIRHHISNQEAKDEAHDAFHAWSRKVAQSIPIEFSV